MTTVPPSLDQRNFVFSTSTDRRNFIVEVGMGAGVALGRRGVELHGGGYTSMWGGLGIWCVGVGIRDMVWGVVGHGVLVWG